ncbi:CopG family transcriptional regulator [candidate division MSBL1 archaeon SCGC-AAA259I09]|uniref:CopG family transcriptional regulator n=4 Tax=candidate division MSBL1 TaxID=215777 RepID=A0A133USR0_9EURY|nr:CopG family transcriptional regulator [candidate division MSBL1 archaeon SCGC-AAA259I14]KXA97381.1 CopG family transcriptional regulator [candidate division MSBL1 archaeon SCGC-AAA259I09]KXA97873.1 CopG family transcriptional regulator [candidate division MSBL1 archaeon SCGC-AAA259J03]KXA99579.1 CopG family transcriptional regulator [candidate division MSBL1 archaeon SCGC-AAA259M10]
MGEKSEKTKFTTVSIPIPLFEKLKEQIEGTGFNSVSSYVGYILREIVAEKGKAPFTEEDEEKIRKKLKALGYLE